MDPLSASDVCTRYALSPDSAPSEKPHLIQLSFACSKAFNAKFIEELTSKDWKNMRYKLPHGGWITGTGHLSQGWSRAYINFQFRRMQKAMQWAAVEGLVSFEAYQKISILPPLHKHQIEARESVPVGVVPWRDVEAIKQTLHPRVWDMVQVQWWTGMRNCELVRINTAELDTSLEQSRRVWFFRPAKHKTANKNKTKVIVIGQSAIDILKAYWPPLGGSYFFTTRKGTPMTTSSYRSAVYLAIDRSKCQAWHPHQLRHSRSAIVDQSLGREACAALLGNTISAAAIYAQRNLELAIEAANIGVKEAV